MMHITINWKHFTQKLSTRSTRVDFSAWPGTDTLRECKYSNRMCLVIFFLFKSHLADSECNFIAVTASKMAKFQEYYKSDIIWYVKKFKHILKNTIKSCNY